MEDIRKAFVTHSESMIRKRLKCCATFQRTGNDSNWWILGNNIKLMTEEEIQQKVSPENCCQYYSMLAAEQRLKDMGYGDKSGIYAEIDEDVNPDDQSKLEIECLNAPWNTTRAYLQAMTGSCLLQISGKADPTGSKNMGFSYIRVPNKPTSNQIQKMRQQHHLKGEQRKNLPLGLGNEKSNLPDTAKNTEDLINEMNEEEEDNTITDISNDADLRKLPLDKAKEICREFGVRDSDLQNLKRWDVIDVVRQIASTMKKEGRAHEMEAISNFSRGNKFSMNEHKLQNSQEAQDRFELQNRMLADDSESSTDDETTSDESDEESDEESPMNEALANMIENSLRATKGASASDDKSEEQREAERMIKKLLADEGKKKQEQAEKAKMEGREHIITRPKEMIIKRRYYDGEGNEYVKKEKVTKPDVIIFYERIKMTMTQEQIIEYLNADPEFFEEYQKERRHQCWKPRPRPYFASKSSNKTCFGLFC